MVNFSSARRRRAPGVRWRQMKSGGYYEIHFRYEGRTIFERAGTDFRAAVRLRRHRQEEVRNGTFSPEQRTPDGMTVEAAITRWVDLRRGDVVTVATEEARFRDHVFPNIGAMPIRAVRTKHILDMLDAWKVTPSPKTGKPIAESTRANVWGALMTFWDDAVQRDWTDANPLRGVRKAQRPSKPKRHRSQKRAYPASSIAALIGDGRVPPDRRVLWALTFFLGLRISEAIGLRWEDIDWSWTPLARVHLYRQWHDRKRCYAGLKGRRGEEGPPRDIPVHPELARILAEWRVTHWPRLYGRAAGDQDLVVPQRRDAGAPRLSRTLYDSLRDDCRRLGIEFIDLHALRRSFGTIAKAAGADGFWIDRILHNAHGTTLDTYINSDWEALCRAVDAIPVRARRSGDVVALPRTAGADALARSLARDGEGTEVPDTTSEKRRPQRDLNPRYRLERAGSWAS